MDSKRMRPMPPKIALLIKSEQRARCIISAFGIGALKKARANPGPNTLGYFFFFIFLSYKERLR